MNDKAQRDQAGRDQAKNEELIDRSQDLTARERAAGGPAAIITSLVVGARQQRRFIKWAVAGVILDVVLSILLGVAYFQINSNTVTAKNSCRSDNAFRVDDRQVWKQFLDLPAPFAQTPALALQRKQNEARLNALLDTTFAPRACK